MLGNNTDTTSVAAHAQYWRDASYNLTIKKKLKCKKNAGHLLDFSNGLSYLSGNMIKSIGVRSDECLFQSASFDWDKTKKLKKNYWSSYK